MKLRDSCMSKKKECIIATILTLVMAAKSGKTERQFRFIGMPFHFSGTLYYN